MKLVGNYKNDIRDLIQGSEQYIIPNDIFIPEGSSESQPSNPPTGYIPNINFMIDTLSPQEQWIWDGGQWQANYEETLIYNDKYKVKLSVFQNGVFQEEYILEIDKDFYIKNNEIYLRPNELLDREEYFEGNYTLRFDFIKRYEFQDLYLSEISSTRKEIRLRYQNATNTGIPKINQDKLTNFLNETNTPSDTADNYKFNAFIELTGGVLIPINNYAFDSTIFKGYLNS